jgi:DNA-binding FrmR family transcriptional regulator
MTTIRDEKHRRELVMRLKRIEGQLRGIQAMIEGGAECEPVTQQLSAARRALDKAFFQVVACAVESGAKHEAAALLAKFG